MRPNSERQYSQICATSVPDIEAKSVLFFVHRFKPGRNLKAGLFKAALLRGFYMREVPNYWFNVYILACSDTLRENYHDGHKSSSQINKVL